MNFVLFEDEEHFLNYYEEVITKLMGKSRLNYKIYKISKYDVPNINLLQSIRGKKIYILDIEVPGGNGLDISRQIRKKGDWTSPIIVVTSHKEYKEVGFTAKMLMLDFIVKDEYLKKNLTETLNVALDIIASKPSYNFTYKGEYFSLPYDEIMYFEKSLNNNHSIIVCENQEYIIRKTIKQIEDDLVDSNFIKTHRSCIVNLCKIIRIDKEKGIIYFKNRKLNLLSRQYKVEVLRKIEELNAYNS